MLWRLWSFFGVCDRRGAEPRESLLLRWLVETPWYPTALCSRRYVHWEMLDHDNAARATVADGATRASAVFVFSPDCSQILSITGERSWHDPRAPALPWTVEFSSYKRLGGFVVPTTAVVKRAAGARRDSVTLVRAEVTDVEYQV
ncbi:unnamed protein product, partial [Phaeothamnion confervicola]